MSANRPHHAIFLSTFHDDSIRCPITSSPSSSYHSNFLPIFFGFVLFSVCRVLEYL
jgi:hypothetical protein